jgi:serine/threonine protein kinase
MVKTIKNRHRKKKNRLSIKYKKRNTKTRKHHDNHSITHSDLHHNSHHKKFKHNFFSRVGHKLHGDKSVAGRAIASGGFGCVFSPELKCADKPESSALEKHKRVSKVMIKRYAIEEYEEIQAIRTKLSKVPNYSRYFLVDGFTLCKIKSFSKHDLLNFKKGCKALKRDEIDETNINKPEVLDKLLALNMINGGITVDEHIEKHIHNGIALKKMNDNLTDLLINGIIPMNKVGVYHCDIKDSNILIDSKKQPRLIDWGLSTEYHRSMNENTNRIDYPSTWYNRPLQYNVPFSVILFTDMFIDNYPVFLKKHGEKNGEEFERELKEFLRIYIHNWKKDRGLGHYDLINQIVSILFKQEINNNVMVHFNKSSSIKDSEESLESGEIKESGRANNELKNQDMLHIIKKNVNHTFTTSVIVNYLYQILEKFRKNNNITNPDLLLRRYLNDVFIEVVDVWGFINTYYPLLEYYYDHSQSLSSKGMQLFDKLKYIFKEYLYSPRVTKINMDDLVNDLKDLDEYF